MGNTQGGTDFVSTGQRGLQTLAVPRRQDPCLQQRDSGQVLREASCCPRGTHSWSLCLDCPSVAQVAPFPSPPSVPLGGHLLSTAGEGQRCLRCLQSSRHRGECVLGAAVCYKYTSESENQMPPARQPVCPAASSTAWGPSPPRPAQSGLLSKLSTLNKGRLNGREGDLCL